jgi:ceramide glucosyltransferase
MSLVGLSLWWSLFYLAISLLQKGDTHVGLYLIVAVLVTSLISIVVTNAKFVRDKKLWQFLWVVPIQEFVRLPLVMHSGLTNEVAWGEKRFRINPDCTASLVVAKHSADRMKEEKGK